MFELTFLKSYMHSDDDASWALRWVAGHPNVHVCPPGMSAEEQLADNLTTFDHFDQ